MCVCIYIYIYLHIQYIVIILHNSMISYVIIFYFFDTYVLVI